MPQRKKPAKRTNQGLTKIGDLFEQAPELKEHLPVIKPGSHVGLRLIEASQSLDPKTILYQHSVFCQAGLPYRDPGVSVRSIERVNGNVGLKVLAGESWHPHQNRFVEVGIPFGTKPRLILADINTQAIKKQKAEIDLEETLTKFVKRMHLAPKGQNIKGVKDAMTRLCAASIRLGLTHGEGSGLTVNGQLMSSFDIWFPKNDRQRVLWPSTATLSHEYFQSLVQHGVPLDEEHYLALSHSAMALDIYAWLAQRLHRIKANEHLVTWPNLHMQFGWHYHRLRDFRRAFKVALRQVLTLYKAARVEEDEGGLKLRNSPPPILKTQVLIP